MSELLDLKIVSVREMPEYKDRAIEYLQQSWPEVYPVLYQDCIENSINAEQFLPQWYLLLKDEEVIGCAGLIPNDFISRMDLYPWLCALYIAEEHRGNSYAGLMLDKAKNDTRDAGFKYLYLSTDHVGLYEKYGFEYIGQGYHPWEESSRIYRIEL